MSARYEITDDARPRALVHTTTWLRPSDMHDDDAEFIGTFRRQYERSADEALANAIRARDEWLTATREMDL